MSNKPSTTKRGSRKRFAAITPTQKRAGLIRPNKLRDVEDMQRDVRQFTEYVEKAPDWLTNVLVHTIETVARLTGYPAPEWSPEETHKGTIEKLDALFNAVMVRDIDPTDSKTRVRLALYELLHNPDCPQNLYEACGRYVCDQSNEAGENIFHSDQVLAVLIDSVPLDGLRKYIQAQNAREAKRATEP